MEKLEQIKDFLVIGIPTALVLFIFHSVLNATIGRSERMGRLQRTIESGSRDPKTKLNELELRDILNKLVFFIVILLILIVLYFLFSN